MRNLQYVLDDIAYEMQQTVRELQTLWKKKRWTANSFRGAAGPPRNVRDVVDHVRQMPDHLSDLAADGSCAMRTLLGYVLKAFAVLNGFAGLIVSTTAFAGRATWNGHQLSVGLSLIIFAQFIWWGGHMLHKSAARRRHAQYQHRLLKLARQKGGSLTVLEAATDGRMSVDRAEEILRELAARGHAEVRVSDSGLIVYHFPEIERWDEKHWARPVDEL